MSAISDLRKRVNELQGEKNKLEEQSKNSAAKIKSLRRELHFAEKAHVLIQKVAQETQEQLRYQLSELPQLALSSVFDDPYQFEVEFEIRRGKTEVDFWFVREGQRIHPKESAGLGSVDIAGMALRPALWSLQVPRTRPCIILDEPFKHLKGEDANRRALAILAEICKPRPEQNWPGLQIIMIADERSSREELIEVADRVWDFTMKGRRTITRRLK